LTEGRLRSAIAFFAVAGLGIAAYLTYAHYSGTQLFCATGGCETVQHSRYAVVAGVPVAVLGLVAYLAFLGTTVRGQTAATAGVCVAVVAVLFSTYLLLAQLLLIHAVCQWCVASDIVVTILAALTAARFLVSRGAIPRATPERSRSGRAPRGSAGGASA
jgi:uncharacterized membrane protein